MALPPRETAPPVPSRIRVRSAEDYEMATEPTFAVDYAGDNGLDKVRKNPWVVVGAGVTAGVLGAGLLAFQRGNGVWSQRLMRARVLAQGATLVILAASVQGMRGEKGKDKENK